MVMAIQQCDGRTLTLFSPMRSRDRYPSTPSCRTEAAFDDTEKMGVLQRSRYTLLVVELLVDWCRRGTNRKGSAHDQ